MNIPNEVLIYGGAGAVVAKNIASREKADNVMAAATARGHMGLHVKREDDPEELSDATDRKTPEQMNEDKD